MIQTHYFCTRFGEGIDSATGLPFVEFHLLPTWEELTDFGNPLNPFPKFQRLTNAAMALCAMPHFRAIDLANWSYTGLQRGLGGKNLSADAFMKKFASPLPQQHRKSLIDCFNAFNKGAQRTVIYLMAMNDFRQINNEEPIPAGGMHPRINPPALSSVDVAEIVFDLKYQQSKKVIAIYAQRAHANQHALPVDTWIAAILAHPLNVALYDYKNGGPISKAENLKKIIHFISAAKHLGKVERLLWLAAQAKKIHSPICDDALWCIKESAGFKARGANPLACKACVIRKVCPAFDSIRELLIGFNGSEPKAIFNLITSEVDNTSHGQTFKKSIWQKLGVIDEDT